jgi:hypothetical protein
MQPSVGKAMTDCLISQPERPELLSPHHPMLPSGELCGSRVRSALFASLSQWSYRGV